MADQNQNSAPQQSQNFVISFEIAQAIANYLVTQPYGQVFQLIAALQNLKPVSDGSLAKFPKAPQPSSEPLPPQSEQSQQPVQLAGENTGPNSGVTPQV